jgi:hypothetical protein
MPGGPEGVAGVVAASPADQNEGRGDDRGDGGRQQGATANGPASIRLPNTRAPPRMKTGGPPWGMKPTSELISSSIPSTSGGSGAV